MKATLYSTFLLLFISCCKEDPPPCNDPTNPKCPDFDSCLVFVPADAAFLIIDSIYGVDCVDGKGRQDLVTEVDSTFTNSDLYFRALNNADSYTWRIGSDPTLHHEKSFVIYFPDDIAPATIPVTLITCKDPPSGCLTRTCDTLTKSIYLYFTEGADSSFSLVIGKFRGVDTESPQDSFTIIIPPPLPSLVGIVNFPNGCQGQFLDVLVSRKGFILYPTPTVCQSACGIGRIMDDRKTLVIDYSIADGNQRKLKKFIGIKLN